MNYGGTFPIRWSSGLIRPNLMKSAHWISLKNLILKNRVREMESDELEDKRGSLDQFF